MGLLSEWLKDEEFLVAAGLLTAGSQGQSIGQAAFPAILQAAQVKKAFGDTAKSTKSVWSIKDNKNVLASDKVIAENPDNYLPAKKEKNNKFGLGDATLAVYNKLNVATNDDEWNKIFDGLSKSEKHIYNNKIKNNPNIIEETIAAKIEKTKTLDAIQISAAAEYKLSDKVKDYENSVDIIEAQWSANPTASFEQVIESLLAAGLLVK
jgi:hypothetical protein